MSSDGNERTTVADVIIESMPFAQELIAWCAKHPAFKEGLKITNPANFIALGAVFSSSSSNAPDDEVIGFLAYDSKRKLFKQDFIVNVGRNRQKFILYSKVPSKKYGPYVQHINQFFAAYGQNGHYAGAHHMTLEALDRIGNTALSERARRSIALAERIETYGVNNPSQDQVDETLKLIRLAKSSS